MFHTSKIALLAGLGLTAFCFGCHMSPPAQPMPGQVADSHRAPRAVTAADQNNSPLMPDPNLTPGATLPVATGDICVPGYSKKVRNVPLDVKQQVYAEYGITSHQPGEYEVDHLISLELGGSNSIKNLWPQSYLTQPWNAHVKDALENELHAEVCSGKVDLPTAQHDISTDWIAAYKKYFHTTGPLSQANSAYTSRPSRRHSRHPLTGIDTPFPVPTAPASTAPTGTASASGQVWVNLNSGKYFQPGSKYYGHTKSGQYMSESDAVKQGYVAAKGQ